MDTPTKQRPAAGKLAPLHLSATEVPSGVDLEAATNGAGEDGDEDLERRDSLTGGKVHPKARAGAGPTKSNVHEYKEVPTTDQTVDRVRDANEEIKSKFHHGKITRQQDTRPY
jgi:hypothetical protein